MSCLFMHACGESIYFSTPHQVALQVGDRVVSVNTCWPKHTIYEIFTRSLSVALYPDQACGGSLEH